MFYVLGMFIVYTRGIREWGILDISIRLLNDIQNWKDLVQLLLTHCPSTGGTQPLYFHGSGTLWADTTQLCDLSLKGIFFCTKKLKFNQAGIFNKCVPIYE